MHRVSDVPVAVFDKVVHVTVTALSGCEDIYLMGRFTTLLVSENIQ